MSGPCQSACSPWLTVEQVRDQANCPAGISDATLDDLAIPIATDMLYESTRRRFPGSCLDTIRPCSLRVADTGVRVPANLWPWSTCTCLRSSDCGCSRVSEIPLPRLPATSITEVKVDGVVLDAARYRIDNFGQLVRRADADGSRPGWPCCADVTADTDEPDTFEVTYTYGVGPPPAGVLAAALLACQYGHLLTPGLAAKCVLPARARQVTRTGVTLDLSAGPPIIFGIFAIDSFIDTYANPKVASGIVDPDQIVAARRTTG